MEELSQNITTENQEKRVGKPFEKGNPGGPGRPKKTEVQRAIDKEIKKTVKEYLANYEQGLAEALPNLSPALIEQAQRGNIKAFAEIHKVLGAHKAGGNVVVPIQINFNEDREKYA